MKPHVLVIDDCLTVRMDLRGALSAAGFEVTLCDTKRAANTVLEQQQFAAVLLDVMLPDGDGMSILREIRNRERSAHWPVVVLSSETEVRDRVRGLTMGADEYVGKPYDVGYIIRRLRELCHRNGLGTGLSTGPKRSYTPTPIPRSYTPHQGIKAVTQHEGFATNGQEPQSVRSLEASANAFAIPTSGVDSQRHVYSPLFFGIVMTMGLNGDSACDGLARTLRRMQVDPYGMNTMDLSRVLPMLHDMLFMFLPPEEAHRRAQSLAGMITRSRPRAPRTG